MKAKHGLKTLNVAILAILIALLCIPSAVKADVSFSNVDIPDKVYTAIQSNTANCTITVTATETGTNQEYVTVPVLVDGKPKGVLTLDFVKNTTTETSGVTLESGRQAIYYPFQTPTDYTDYSITVGSYTKTVSVYAEPDPTPIAMYSDVILIIGLLWFFRRMSHG